MTHSATGAPDPDGAPAGAADRAGDGWDWAGLAALAAVRLGWPPAVFWAATPRELAAALALIAGAGSGGPARHPMGRAELRALIRRFPDR
ncbi:putative phage protein (TIGR02216 family) [Rhodothalassium salexigens DSM 2132]|uniref:Putative phage protein (TIGR02216 family) n=1 Tax=Rhodothalassium salexigens DSM 2132 TaxID=1188247 RepID=A0A4R2PL70_RHOSA|nr:phage tail assembly chaperone [Rhodothalassium salexigens]MBB4210999.1 putative phage protein (TIGR02216 family) [Rhodothalassium salexigens DSM 2132]MBK1638730.1 hypothetical protein [Rhodothalassium salexigens DSM 2132]TCP36343.1 putative phage protein (TIGR02216 family) [Rhodothalassium salexigens DSM 2132]